MNTIVVFKLNESRKPKNIMNLFYKIVASINKIYWRKIRVIMTGQFSTCFYLLLSLLVERLWICFCCLAFILITTMLILLFLHTNFEKNLSRLTKITYCLHGTNKEIAWILRILPRRYISFINHISIRILPTFSRN